MTDMPPGVGLPVVSGIGIEVPPDAGARLLIVVVVPHHRAHHIDPQPNVEGVHLQALLNHHIPDEAHLKGETRTKILPQRDIDSRLAQDLVHAHQAVVKL